MQRSFSNRLARFFGGFLAVPLLLSAVQLNAQELVIDPGCENYAAWTSQSNPRSDATGINNRWFPEYNATYWAMDLSSTLGSVVTLKGQYPKARYISLQVYDQNRNILSALTDVDINPDPGQNNPYRTGLAQGTYTVRLVFGRQPEGSPAPNTLYTGRWTSVRLFYRVYYSIDPNSLLGAPVDPPLPDIIVNGATLATCPPRPILPEESTLSGRLDDIDYIGTPPPNKVRVPLFWQFWLTNPLSPFPFPNQDTSYMAVITSREFLMPPMNYDMIVIRMKAPTFADTQAGVPPYAPANVRYWSMCQEEVVTTSVVRCIPDHQAATLNGVATIVISDPSKRPSAAVLNKWGATWMPWGALLPADFIYSILGNPLTNANGVFFYGLIVYRQLVTDPNFQQSIEKISQLPATQRQAAMGEYWPAIGYCRTLAFQVFGAGCIKDSPQ